jgi:hypothetical protein
MPKFIRLFLTQKPASAFVKGRIQKKRFAAEMTFEPIHNSVMSAALHGEDSKLVIGHKFSLRLHYEGHSVVRG